MKFNPNLGRFNGATFGLMPPGKYAAEIVEATLETANTGTEFLNLDFRILEPIREGRHIWAKLFLTEKAAWKTAAFLNAIDEKPTGELDTESLVGKSLVLVVKITQGEDGVERNEVTAFRKPQQRREIVPAV